MVNLIVKLYPITEDGTPSSAPILKRQIIPNTNKLQYAHWWDDLQYVPPEASTVSETTELDVVQYRRIAKYIADNPGKEPTDVTAAALATGQFSRQSTKFREAVAATKIEHVEFKDADGNLIHEAEGDTCDEPDWRVETRDGKKYRSDTGAELTKGEELDLMLAQIVKIEVCVQRGLILEPMPGDPPIAGWYYYERDGIIYRQRYPVAAATAVPAPAPVPASTPSVPSEPGTEI